MGGYLLYAGLNLIASGVWILLGREPRYRFIAAGRGLLGAAVFNQRR